uniref:blue-sensitive opsin-like n=1 Tax=Ciona intestinalis TaxID=7719 RepID=UPI000180C6DF|nr:blue-sensitive opsin-like [Ciona intestinalis]|eukprot:XP_026690745.1 blue-sensitive opsin-like [Ciona intestinalis]
MTSQATMLQSTMSSFDDMTFSSAASYFNFSDLNTTMVATRQPYVRPFGTAGIITSAVILFTCLVIGVIGNVLTIVVILTNQKLRNLFMYFIVSLCVSDLTSALISWLFLYRRTWGFDVWDPIPGIFCKFYWAADVMTNYVTASHIFSFALIRYISIQFPIRFSKIKLIHGKIWIALIWFVCFCVGFIPWFIFFGARIRDRYSDSPDARWPACTINMEWYDQYTLATKVCYSIFLYAPSVGVVFLSILIGITVKSRPSMSSQEDGKRKQKEKQAVLQLVLIVVSFLIGYVPFTAYEFWSTQPRPNTMYYKSFDYWFGMSEYFCIRISECLNPIFYNLGSAKMRKCTAGLLRKMFGCKRQRKVAHVSSSHGTQNFGV